MPNKRLMSVVDAAGYAMAPADEFVGQAVDRQLDNALRNGHQSAARVAPPVKHPPSPLMLQLEAWSLWVRDVFGFGGRAAA